MILNAACIEKKKKHEYLPQYFCPVFQYRYLNIFRSRIHLLEMQMLNESWQILQNWKTFVLVLIINFLLNDEEYNFFAVIRRYCKSYFLILLVGSTAIQAFFVRLIKM